ncbi:hypothetical protein CC1G_08565 [Coprinopsis cinerea okayama7|uniref:Uncharacterized protein n=1 Tax=Coprinopsis cinerea (strain Okayama-7 / 130 / ATCC MYA-4618 / FGSC 9003) TaxID=240176 RepID=A8NCS4_COPC7|nr:hypothetical protein CC1G_08565 [Coprinopsis cinerea okayama7\|eukprot:XP_001832615.2 hypothetical protein CC1G_08565 [Coprinopsis cinerea okayama7\
MAWAPRRLEQSTTLERARERPATALQRLEHSTPGTPNDGSSTSGLPNANSSSPGSSGAGNSVTCILCLPLASVCYARFDELKAAAKKGKTTEDRKNQS